MTGDVIHRGLPRRRTGLWLRQTQGENAVYDPASGNVHLLNETAWAIWDLCDGDTRPEEMIDAIVEVSHIHPEVVTEDVRRILAEFDDAGIVTWVGPSTVERPRARDDLTVVEIDGEAVVYDGDAGELHHLNPTATLVFSLLDGTTTVRELALEISGVVDLSVDEIERQIEDVVTTFADAGLLFGGSKDRSDAPIPE